MEHEQRNDVDENNVAVEFSDDHSIYLHNYLANIDKLIKDVEQRQENNIRSNSNQVLPFDLNRNNRLWSMKIQNEFIDSVIISDDGHREPVHIDIFLSLKGDVIEAMKLTQVLNDNKQLPPIKEYSLNTPISGEVLKQLVFFAYNQHCQLNNDNAMEIANISSTYRLVPLINYCLDYFVDNISIQNAIKAFDLSIKFSYKNVMIFKKFVEDNFKEMFLKFKMNFLLLNFEALFDLLTSPRLNLINEETVWQLIFEWICHDQQHRQKHLEKLFKEALRFGRLTDKYVQQVVMTSQPFRCLTPETVSNFIQWMNDEKTLAILIEDGYGLNYSRDSIYFQPRETKELLLLAGGWVEGKTTNTIEVYDYQTNQWLSPICRLEKKISYFGMEIVDDSIYMFGGSNGREVYSSCFQLNLNNNEQTPKWAKKCSMIHTRCYVSTASLNGLIYALGGFNQQTRLRACERYNPVLDSWQQIAELNYARSDASAVVHNEKIFIAGGINDVCIENTVEIYSPENNVWRLVKQMNFRRTTFSIVSFQNKIWALGGNDGQKRTDTVECYDPENNTWTMADSMLVKRSTFRAMVMKDELYVVGGYNGQSPICNVEKYVPQKGWTKVRPLRHDRSGMSLIRIPNKFKMFEI